LIGAVYNLVEDGCIPGASFRNLEYADDNTDFASDLDYNLKMIAFDAQTSGGLLISAKPERAEDILAELKSAGLSGASIVGEVINLKEKFLYLLD
jgi:selenide,water dikinase